jgi:hypothetical protein
MKNCLPLFNHKMAARVTAAFQIITEMAEPSHADAAPSGNRLNHHAVFVHDYGSAFLQHKAVDGRRRIVLIVDFSGSMSGMWTMMGGAEFVWGLMQFARQGDVDLRVILTGSSKGPALLPNNLPFEVFCSLFPGHGQEAFRATMLHPFTASLMEDADMTICWTDGYLTDGYVDAVEWRAKGINVIGAVIGSPKTEVRTRKGVFGLLALMQSYFHAGFVNSDPSKLASLIATHIANTPIRDLA